MMSCYYFSISTGVLLNIANVEFSFPFFPAPNSKKLNLFCVHLGMDK